MPWGPYSTDLPLSGTPATRRVSLTAWDAGMDNHPNWKGNVNGGGYVLSNVRIIAGSIGINGSAVLTFGLITAGDFQESFFTLTGAAVGQTVVEAWPSTLESAFRGAGMMYVSAPNTVKVRLYNTSNIDATPAANQTFGASVNVGSTPGSLTLDFGIITPGDWQVLTFPYVGATPGAPLAEAWPADLPGGLSGVMWVSAVNVVSVRLENRSGLDIDLAPKIFGAAFL